MPPGIGGGATTASLNEEIAHGGKDRNEPLQGPC